MPQAASAKPTSSDTNRTGRMSPDTKAETRVRGTIAVRKATREKSPVVAVLITASTSPVGVRAPACSPAPGCPRLTMTKPVSIAMVLTTSK